MIYKLTVQGGLLEIGDDATAMKTLKRWREEGKVDLIDTNPPRDAVAPVRKPETDGSGRRRVNNRRASDSGKVSFKAVAAAIYPGKDPLKLDMAEINSVAHLIKHHTSKNEIFVTADVKSFIAEGRRELLKAQFGILAMTPEETVQALSELQGWPAETTTGRRGGSGGGAQHSKSA